VALTSAGETFLNRVSSSVADIADAIDAARGQANEPQGVLRINSSVTAGHEILSPLIATYLDRHPAMQVELVTDQRLVDIVRQGFDAGVRLTDSVPGDMIAVPLGSSLDFSVVGSPLYFAQHPEPTTPHDLMYHRCIRSRWAGGGFYRWEFQNGDETFNVDVAGALILDEQSLILKAAISGAGVAYLADTFTREAVEAGQLKYILMAIERSLHHCRFITRAIGTLRRHCGHLLN
jgi:DNA-binding transcriptional LysR family regulator